MKLLKELYAYRHMIFQLVRRELRGRYKGSFLGFLWTFINPLLQLLVYSLLFGVLLKASTRNGGPYPLFLFVALIPWIFFQTSITAGSMSVLGQKNLVTKIYFPREILPISFVFAAFVNMLLSFIVVFAVIFVWHFFNPIVVINWLQLLWLPFIWVIELLFTLGFTMITSSVTVYVRDMEHILGIVVMAWTYLTPVMYDSTLVTEKFASLFGEKGGFLYYIINPMASIIVSYRDVLYFGVCPDLKVLLIALAYGIIFVILGFLIFGKLKKRFAEEM